MMAKRYKKSRSAQLRHGSILGEIFCAFKGIEHYLISLALRSPAPASRSRMAIKFRRRFPEISPTISALQQRRTTTSSKYFFFAASPPDAKGEATFVVFFVLFKNQIPLGRLPLAAVFNGTKNFAL
jgi:hypothetical protein